MTQYIRSPRFIALTLLIILAAFSRALPLLIPHIWNFTAVGALAIFSGAQFRNKSLAFIMPLATMALSDLFIGNGFSLIVYTAFIAMVICGFLIRNRINVSNIVLSSVAGALVFFLITNFAFLYSPSLYPHNLSGIIASYVAALPFLNNMVLGNLAYGSVLFGSFYFISKRFPALSVR
ncbi:DUF6580 family putative transport protein [Daejeonella oryzae]|uniref:DUF6580 family putative transport protein n=1 Tax=Daejeonella oryzae TaxID=1122943 RepID=UPI00047E150E|nr:DUF6580 family putative transport protein [Daejeonella oryzae]